MSYLNTIPIEKFLEKQRIASKSGQKVVNLEIKDATALAECLSVLMARVLGQTKETPINTQPEIKIKMDGGSL